MSLRKIGRPNPFGFEVSDVDITATTAPGPKPRTSEVAKRGYPKVEVLPRPKVDTDEPAGPARNFRIGDIFSYPSFPTKSKAVSANHAVGGVTIGTGMKLSLGLPKIVKHDLSATPCLRKASVGLKMGLFEDYSVDSDYSADSGQAKIQWAEDLVVYCEPYQPFDWEEFDETEKYGPLPAMLPDLNIPQVQSPVYRILVEDDGVDLRPILKSTC